MSGKNILGKNFKFKMLVIFSITIMMCLSTMTVLSLSVKPEEKNVYTNGTVDFLMPAMKPNSKNIIKEGDGRELNVLSDITALIKGADYLKHAQADITEDNANNGGAGTDSNDGGWDWVLTYPIVTHSASASPKNIYGVTAQGLYYAYLVSPDASYMTAMTDAANYMKNDANIRSASDLIFLMLYDDLPSVYGTTYQAAAKTKYDARISVYGSATALAVYIRDARNTQGYPDGIIAWDIGVWVKAAAMLNVRYPSLGYDTDADNMAEVLYQDSYMNNPGYFDIIDDQGFDPLYGNVNYYWYTLGITGLIDAFDAAQVHTSEIPGLLTILFNCQYSSGAFSYSYGANTNDEGWQSTAYAVMTLGNLNAYTYRNQIQLACAWIASTQHACGGWVYSDNSHYPEIGGENTAALYFAGPNKPSTPSGQTNGKINVEYTYNTTTTDPNNDQVYYKWSWGDGNISDWLGPFTSGAIATTQHAWNTKGSYEIKVKAKDMHGLESDWSDPLPITMPYSYNKPILQFLELLFQRFPHAFPILKQMLGY
ncbi:MAG: PKD domain-containing protein [Euryarchaeota archaeon]|nr:PKD domain-containing protein [Euryarchaeota archaeon]